MAKKTLVAITLAGFAFFAVPSAANAEDYVPNESPPVSTTKTTGVTTTSIKALAQAGFDASVLLLPAGGVLLLGLGLVAAPRVIRSRKADA